MLILSLFVDVSVRVAMCSLAVYVITTSALRPVKNGKYKDLTAINTQLAQHI